MSQQPHHSQLREVFELIEHDTPDPAAVYARVEELAKRYKRRRRGAQVAAGGLIGAGLIAGALNLPAFLPATTGGPAATATVPAAAPSTNPEQALQEQLAAYEAAGYGYDNAVELAKLWNQGGNSVVSVKAEAGRRLLLGETLPVKPSPDEPAAEAGTTPEQERQLAAFFSAGYVFADAEKLAETWNLPSAGEAKIEGGKRLLAGQELPVKPKPANVADALQAKRVAAFFDKGYDLQDAARLAGLWNLATPHQAKVEGGKRLLAGQTLPIQP